MYPGSHRRGVRRLTEMPRMRTRTIYDTKPIHTFLAWQCHSDLTVQGLMMRTYYEWAGEICKEDENERTVQAGIGIIHFMTEYYSIASAWIYPWIMVVSIFLFLYHEFSTLFQLHTLNRTLKHPPCSLCLDMVIITMSGTVLFPLLSVFLNPS